MRILNAILQMSLTGSVLFLITYIFKPFTRKIFSATWNYYMLFTVLIVFLIPIGSFVEFPQIIDYRSYVTIQDMNKDVQTNNEKISEKDIQRDEIHVLQEDGQLRTVKEDEVNLKEIKTIPKILEQEMLPYVWIIGVIIFIFREAYVFFSFYKKLKSISNIVEDESVIHVLNTCKKTLKISKKIGLKECSGIRSPMITGILSTVITIPKIDYNLDKLKIILTHELIHYKRKDLWIKIVALIANIINWFNPFTYIIRNKINIDCELSLDEQLVKSMDRPKRKDYGEIILELIEYSQNNSLSLGAAVCKNREELETRLNKIIFFKRPRKIIVCISILVSMIFTSTSVLAASTAFVKSNISLNNIKSTEFAVFVSKDGLYMSELKENNPIILDKSDKIKLPIISKDGLYVAYIKEDNLYVCNTETHEITEVAKNVESYNWNNFGSLIYGVKNKGLSVYNASSKNSNYLINNDYNYFNINCDSKNKVYANKDLEYIEGNNHYIKSIGIISYDLDDKSEKLILEGKTATNKELEEGYTNSDIFESLGSTPNVSQISKDDKYIYIWNKPKSGSVSSDMTEFAVYDVLNNKFMEFNNMDDSYALGYRDNISQNPVNSDIVALNAGTGREMFNNKAVGILNIKTNTFIPVFPANQVSMTPCYSDDGKNILYSSARMLEDVNNSQNLKTWQSDPHNIYEVNAENRKITQITKGNYFDFMPKYLSNNEILFVREDGDSYSLWKTKDGIETKLAESLDFRTESYTHSWYYGHFDTENVIDVFIG